MYSTLITAATRHAAPLTELDLPRLREDWIAAIADLVGPIPLSLPPLRAINHEIPLINPKLLIRYHQPRCVEAY